MQTKLTLRIEASLIRQAKAHAKRQGKSLSQMVADYFRLLEKDAGGVEETLAPITRSLKGALHGTGVNEQDYRKHLEEKYL